MDKNGLLNESYSHLNEACTTSISTLLTNYANITLLVVIIVTSIVGNLMVWIAIYSDRRLRKLGNLFLASLALADLFVGCFVMTFELTNTLIGHWIFGQRFCDIWISSDVMCCTASILHLCAISLDRYLHIKDPLRYNHWMTRKVTIMSIACVWLISALISFVPVGLGWHKPSYSEKLTRDKEKFQCALDLTPSYAIISSMISFYLPCIFMVALYTRLYLYARKHVKNIKALIKPLYIDNSSDKRNNSDVSSHHQNHHIKDHKAAITLGVIMGVFLVCWVPFFCINIVAGFCKTCIPVGVFKFLTWLGWSNSSLNPIIYSIFNTEFREAFRKILARPFKEDCCRSGSKKDKARKIPYRSHITSHAKGSLALKVVQCGSDAKAPCKFSSIVINDNDLNGNKDFVDVIPIKKSFEIICNQSDGKINSI